VPAPMHLPAPRLVDSTRAPTRPRLVDEATPTSDNVPHHAATA